MKRRSDRMQRVTDLADRHRESAADALAEQDRRLRDAEQQLAELRHYRREYESRPGGSGVDVAALLNRQRFLHRIDQAIAQQMRDIERLRQQLQQARHHWMDQRSRHAALDNVTQRYRDEEQRRDERSEQDAIDERMQHRRSGWRDD